jgi:hypothetical protein
MTRIAKIEMDFDLDSGKAEDIKITGSSDMDEEVNTLLNILKAVFLQSEEA